LLRRASRRLRLLNLRLLSLVTLLQ